MGNVIIGFQRQNLIALIDTMFALYAKEYNYNWYRFNLDDVDFDKEKILGHVLKNGNWIQKECPFPTVINNGLYFKRHPNGYKLYYDYNIPISYAQNIGGKFKLFDNLNKILPLKKYIPYYKKLNNVDQIIDYLKENKKCIIKPNFGSFGKSVYCIELINNYFRINNRLYSDLNKFITDNDFNIKSFLLQQYINSKIINNIPIDIRCHLARSYNKEWKLIDNLVRVNPFSQVHSNLHKGGSKFQLKRFLDYTCNENIKKNIVYQLHDIINILPNQLQKYYKYDFNVLGLDIGIDFSNNGKLYIFELNSFPGTTFVEHKLAKYAIQYDYWLGLQHSSI